LKCTTN